MTKKIMNHAIQYLAKTSIEGSGFLSNIGSAQLGTIVENNVKTALSKVGDVAFKPGSAIAAALTHIEPSFENEPIQSTLAFGNLVKSNISDSSARIFTEVPKAFANKLSGAQKELKECHDTVDLLLKKFNTELSNIAQETPIPDYKSVPMHVEDWNLLGSMGPEHLIINEINAAANISDKEPNLTAFRITTNTMKLKQHGLNEDLTPVTFEEHQKKAIIDKIVKYSGLTEVKVESLFTSLCSRHGVNFYMNRAKLIDFGASSDTYDIIKATVKDIVAFLNGCDKTIVDKTDEATYVDNPTITANLGYFKMVQKVGIYAMSYFRYKCWEHMLILSNGEVNADLQASAKNAGITNDDIRLALYSGKFDTGFSHFTVPYIVSNKERFLTSYQREYDVAANLAAHTKKIDKEKAFKLVSHEYLVANKKVKALNGFAAVMAGEIGSKSKSPEYGFYELVKKTKNLSPLANELMADMSKMFTSLEQQSDNINKRSVEEVQAIVLTNKIVDFILETFC